MRWFLLLLVTCFGVPSDAQPIETPTKTLHFTIGYPENDPRFMYVDLILSNAITEHGFGFKLMALPAGREHIFAVSNDLIDGLSATISPDFWPIESKKFIPLRDPFITVNNVGIARKSFPQLTTWEALNRSNANVVYVRHHYSAILHLNALNATVVDSLEQAIKLFIAGRADVLLGFEASDELSTLPELQTEDFHQPVILSERPLHTYISHELAPYAAAINNSIQHQRQLHPLTTRKQLPKSLLGDTP